MKKLAGVKTVAATAFTLLAASTFAGGIDSKTNLSTGYHRNPSRNTEHERPEAALYNIAGTALMENGLFIEIGDQFVFKNYSNTYTGSDDATNSASLAGMVGKKYTDEEKVFFYPDANIVYKTGDWAFFGAFAVAGGGGTLNYDNGVTATQALMAQTYKTIATKYQTAATLAQSAGQAAAAQVAGATATAAGAAAQKAAAGNDDHSLSVYSVTYGETLGASYHINDYVSVAAGIRLLQTQQDLTLSSSNAIWMAANNGKDAGYNAFGTGVGGILGVHVVPVENLDVAIQYKTITKMNVKFKSMKGNLTTSMLSGATEGDSYYNDMPAELNLGVGYRVIDPLYVNLSFNYYFNKQASISNALNKDAKMDYDNSWEVGGGVDYTINERWLASTGIMYSKQGSTSSANNLFAPVLDCVNFGLGGEFKATDWLTVTAGGVYAKYFERSYTSSGLNMDLNKSVFLCSLGLTFKPL
ncbi:MAG: outer membrane protein transport protein [Treponema sp.]|nr:outer membrane protein transport protein [Treponema sp.]